MKQKHEPVAHHVSEAECAGDRASAGQFPDGGGGRVRPWARASWRGGQRAVTPKRGQSHLRLVAGLWDQGFIPLYIWGVGLWEALFVVSQRWIPFPTFGSSTSCGFSFLESSHLLQPCDRIFTLKRPALLRVLGA